MRLRGAAVIWTLALCAMRPHTSDATEYFQPFTHVFIGNLDVDYHPSGNPAVFADGYYMGSADNTNPINAPATWTRVGARDVSLRSSTNDVVGTFVTDRNTSGSGCVSVTLSISRWRKGGVAAPGSLCGTFSNTFIGQAVRSIDTCASGVTKLFSSANLTMNYSAESSSTGLKGYFTTLSASATRPGFAPQVASVSGCHVINWTSTPPICCF